MSEYSRYAVYFLPDGGFYRVGADWLGWCNRQGTERSHPELAGLSRPIAQITDSPRKYGFHATIKPPFKLAKGQSANDLAARFRELCKATSRVEIPVMEIRRLGSFVAAVPASHDPVLQELAATMVKELDPFRAPASESELAKRRSANLTRRQEEMLIKWGYPHVLEEFRFHLTLSGRLPQAEADDLVSRLRAHFAPVIPQPFEVASLALVGADDMGRFHCIESQNLA
jgi:putative phosphonate metabolism protein